MRAGNQIPNYKETQNYVKNVLGLYWGLKPPAPPVAATPRVTRNSRVRPAISGGALNRGNLPSQTACRAAAAARQGPYQLTPWHCLPRTAPASGARMAAT